MKRNYNFKHIPLKHHELCHAWIKELEMHEEDFEARIYAVDLLSASVKPESSRLESQTDLFDEIEDYVFNRLTAYNIKPEEDAVFKLLMQSMKAYEKCEMYEMCFNIQEAINEIKHLFCNWENSNETTN